MEILNLAFNAYLEGVFETKPAYLSRDLQGIRRDSDNTQFQNPFRLKKVYFQINEEDILLVIPTDKIMDEVSRLKSQMESANMIDVNNPGMIKNNGLLIKTFIDGSFSFKGFVPLHKMIAYPCGKSALYLKKPEELYTYHLFDGIWHNFSMTIEREDLSEKYHR